MYYEDPDERMECMYCCMTTIRGRNPAVVEQATRLHHDPLIGVVNYLSVMNHDDRRYDI